MRLKSTVKNMKYNFIFLILLTLFNFISRFFFIKTLGVDIVGVNSVISNLLGFLNIAELGVGLAITYSLYSPLANGDNEKISEIMYLFKYYYKLIAMIILVAGIILSLFLKFFIKGQVNLFDVYIYYYLFLLGIVASYFYSYKQVFIIADQKQYIVTSRKNTFIIIKLIIQIISLELFRSYIIWIILEVIFNVSALIYISKICDKSFSDIDFKKKYDVKKVKQKHHDITSNIKNTFIHKIVAFIVFETDGLLISLFLNLRYTGVYSNYMLIITGVTGIISTVMSSVTASVGNLIAVGDEVKSYGVFRKLYLIDSFIAIIVTYIMYNLINPFVSVWIGSEYLFGKYAVLFLMLNVYIKIIRGSVERFKEGYGIFWDNFAPILEGLINFVISIILVQKIGVVGLFIGTFISNIVIILMWKPYIVYKKGFHISVWNHVILFSKYTIMAVLTAFISNVIVGFIYNSLNMSNTTLIGFIVYSVVICVSITVISCIVYMSQKEFRSLMKYIVNIRKNI